MKKKFMKVMLYQTLKTFLIFAGFLVIMEWLTNGTIYISVVLKFALWMTLSGVIPIGATLLILFPQLNKKTPEQRLEAFWKYHIPFKLIGVLIILIAISFVLYNLMVPLFGLTLGQVVIVGLGIGFLFGVLATLMVWYIIGLEKPPFWNLNEE